MLRFLKIPIGIEQQVRALYPPPTYPHPSFQESAPYTRVLESLGHGVMPRASCRGCSREKKKKKRNGEKRAHTQEKNRKDRKQEREKQKKKGKEHVGQYAQEMLKRCSRGAVGTVAQEDADGLSPQAAREQEGGLASFQPASVGSQVGRCLVLFLFLYQNVSNPVSISA